MREDTHAKIDFPPARAFDLITRIHERAGNTRNEQSLDYQRRIIRQARARPLLARLFLWLEATLAKLSRKSDTAAAIRYALSRWTALSRYADDGQLEVDNNTAERALRVVALGRKNYLFCGSDAGGERAARIYSLLGSAKLNNLDPELYLHHVLERIADLPINRIQDLLPWNVSINTTDTLTPK